MFLTIKKGIERFTPADEDSVKVFNSLDVGQEITVEYKPRRNYKFHKKYFALLNAVIHNQQHYKTVDNLHESIKFYAGYYETIIPFDGDSFIKTKSISFFTMSAEDFESFYNVAIDECLKLVGDEALEEILRFC